MAHSAVPPTSADLDAELRAKLQELIPDAFRDGVLDAHALLERASAFLPSHSPLGRGPGNKRRLRSAQHACRPVLRAA
jgi:hypothetical protein